MAKTVDLAFQEFLINTVRLDKTESDTAKGSRDWLKKQIGGFPDDGLFPLLHPDRFIDYGSFSRKTKIRPLDDIDFMTILHGQGCYYIDYGSHVEITVNPNTVGLSGLTHSDNYSLINSRKVVNKFTEYLKKVSHYKNADIHRNREAATLTLDSYDWTFDIVPCFITTPDHFGKNFFLIPDGEGHWKKTDPRIDHQRAIDTDRRHNISMRDMIRLMKFWTSRNTTFTIGSYLLEAILLGYYSVATSSDYIDLEIPKALTAIKDNIFSYVADPKNFQGDLNNLDTTEKTGIYLRASLDADRAAAAWELESNKDMKGAIDKWREIFGDTFPTFTL